MTPVDDEPYEPRTRCERAQRVASRAFWYSMGTSPENEGSCRIVIMGWGFLFVFMAFNTTQTILSTVLQHYVGSVSHVEYDLGMASLMIMYVTTCPSLYLIPAVIRNLGAVVTMMLGGLCYAVYRGDDAPVRARFAASPCRSPWFWVRRARRRPAT